MLKKIKDIKIYTR